MLLKTSLKKKLESSEEFLQFLELYKLPGVFYQVQLKF